MIYQDRTSISSELHNNVVRQHEELLTNRSIEVLTHGDQLGRQERVMIVVGHRNVGNSRVIWQGRHLKSATFLVSKQSIHPFIPSPRDIRRMNPLRSPRMSLLDQDGAFLPISTTTSTVTADEWISAINFINRVNFHFESNDQEKMTNAFSPNAKAHFPGISVRGEEEIRALFRDKYSVMIPGVKRYATNHIVDRNEETGGVIVRYQNQLVRYAWPKDVSAPRGPRVAEVLVTSEELPRIWQCSTIMNRLEKRVVGWYICERYVGDHVVDETLNPDKQPC